ncbi:hypothetical protein AYI69_g9181, partial [Smittium culicis]
MSNMVSNITPSSSLDKYPDRIKASPSDSTLDATPDPTPNLDLKLSSDTGVIVLRKPRKASPKESDASVFGKNVASIKSDISTAIDKAPGNEPDKLKKSNTIKSKSNAGWEEVGSVNSGKTSSKLEGLDMIIDLVDGSGMWRNCAGFFGIMFFTFLCSTL